MNENEPTLPEESLFLQALEIGSAGDRVAFLDRACGADAVLRNDVEALLRHHREGTSFLETPPTEVVVAAAQLTTSEPDTPALDFLSPSNDPPSLGRLGYYEVVEVLGRGGFGVVLKARDTKLDRIVAVKTLSQSLATSATARKRFVREAKAAAAVKHENVVGIYHVSDEGSVPYLVMECVNGLSLEAKLQQAGTLDLPAILRIGMQIATGLAAAHKQGLVHRDVKPGNILLENGVERVKITDFGLARAADDAAITKTGDIAGTPQYMSPEQAQGLSLDARSDLFSLGSVLYAMATGRSPFRAESTIAALRRVCDDTPRPIRETNADIPEWLAGIINRLLAKQPSERYQTATEVADLLGLHLAAVQQSAIVPSPKPTIVSRRHPSAIGARWWSVALIALVAVACIMGLTEASGVTKVVPTVIRIVRGEGTLVIEVDDPTVQVALDGEELSIRGAGLKELKLVPGKYRLHATKDGRPVKDEVVTISRDGRKVVTVTRELSGGSGSTVVAPAVEQTVGELKLLAKLEGHSDLVRAVAFLPDGRRIVSVGRDKMVRIWDMETREVLSTLPVEGYLRDADVSADGRFIAMAFASEKDGIVHVWDLEKRERICELVQVDNRIDCIRLSPDGTHVVTGGDPSGGVLWDLSTRKEVRRFSVDDPSATLALEFSPDGRLLAIGAVGRVRLLDIESGDVVGDAQLPQPRAVLGLAFAPSGKSLACGQAGGHTSLIDVDLCRVTTSLPNSDPDAHVLRARFLNDRFLLTTRYDTTLRVWDIERMKVVATAATEKGTNQRLGVSPDGRYAVIAGGEDWNPKTRSYRTNGDYALRLWQLPESVWPKEPTSASSAKESPAVSSVVPAAQPTPDNLTLLTKLQGHMNIVRAVSFLPDGERMVSVDQNTVVRTWDLETRSVLSIFDLKGGRCEVADLSADGRFVAISASAERTRMIRVWDLQNRKQICEAVHQQDVEWLNCIRFTPDGTHVLTSGKPHVGVLWNIATGKEVRRFEVQDSHCTGAAQFSPDGRLLAMEGSGRVRLFDVESGELQGDAHLPEPQNVISLAFSPGGDLLACGHMRGRTDVFEVNSRQLTAQLTNDKSSSHVVSMRFLDNERLLITRFGGALEVWDLPRTKIVATAASELGTTKRLALSPNGRYALAAHGEGWDEQSKSRNPTGDYALRLWQLPESVWPKASRPTSSPAETVEHPATPKDP